MVRKSRTPKIETVFKSVRSEEKRAEIPTTFVPLAPDKMYFESEIDVLFGLFHIMWKDMPTPRRYPLRLADRVTQQGKYLGCRLQCGISGKITFEC